MKFDIKHAYKIFFVGIILISVLIGYLTGVSLSAVVSVVIPAVFGVLGIALAIISESKSKEDISGEEKLKVPRIKIMIVGSVLIFFSVSYFCGVLIGVNVRNATPMKTLPWNNQQLPPRADLAFEWVIIQDYMISQGYRNEDVRNMYKIQFKEWNGRAIDLLPQMFKNIGSIISNHISQQKGGPLSLMDDQ
jgi:hypothetical protein